MIHRALPKRLLPTIWIAGQIRLQMRLDSNGAHAGATTTVGDTKRLVQVQVADIAAQIAGTADAHHRIHVGTVDIDLSAMPVGDFGDFGHGLLKNAVGRWIGDHAARQILAVQFGLGPEIIQINIAVGGGFD